MRLTLSIFVFLISVLLAALTPISKFDASAAQPAA